MVEARNPLPMEVVVEGIVVPGDRRGRLLGFPTANIVPGGDAELPEDGVFAGRVQRADGSWYGAAVSIGTRPTFHGEDAERLVEAFLLDFDGDLYGERLRVYVGERVRGQQRFESIDALIAQMKRDVEVIRRLLDDI